MTWQAQHSFANGELVRAAWLKTLQNNVEELHKPQLIYKRRFDDNLPTYNSTTSATFIAASADYLQARLTLTASRRLLLTANLVSYTSSGTTEGQLGLSVDGVDQGGGNGIVVVPWMDQPVLYSLMWITDLLTAGEHFFQITHRRTAGAGTVNTAPFSRHWFYAVEI